MRAIFKRSWVRESTFFEFQRLRFLFADKMMDFRSRWVGDSGLIGDMQ